MRRAARIDRNQPEIVQALRLAGATVQPLHTIGKGCPDILVGAPGICRCTPRRNLVMELKDGLLPPSRRALTADELLWHSMWAGQVCVVSSVEDALRVLREV